ncbi:hypothetical protein LCGC14_2800270 [marine sediment metagenome]|uniref:Uncharacterized protein n=1 Tax=marine sediment metagenome TaxID=412755 RepID=A0A0F8Z9X5_9ZZZZ
MVKFQLNIGEKQSQVFHSDYLPRVGDHIETGDMLIEVVQVIHHESGTYPWVNAKCTHSGTKHDEWWIKVEPRQKVEHNTIDPLAHGGRKCIECGHFYPNMLIGTTTNVQLSI